MKKTIVSTAMISGILLIAVPRFILPACEYLGHPPMHCSDTARAEYVIGSLLIALGGLSAFMNRQSVTAFALPSFSIVLYTAAFLLPDKIGYCHSSKMPCNYGMVPGIRFVAAASALVMLFALIGAVNSYRKKRNS